MKHTHRAYVRFGFLLMAFGVLLGAFGAHTLKELVDEAGLATWDTGVRYQMVHALALIILGVNHRHFDEKALNIALGLFIVGVFIFSGSLYLLGTLKIWGSESFKVIGAITPVGGISFISGWFWLFLRAYKVEKDNGGIKPESGSGERRRSRRHRSRSESEGDKEA